MQRAVTKHEWSIAHSSSVLLCACSLFAAPCDVRAEVDADRAGPPVQAADRADQLTIPEAAGITMALNVRVPMRDGVNLATDVYRPAGPGKVPVILVRTPYMKNYEGDVKDGLWWAQHGYVFVVQDVRGRGDSDGTFYPAVHEADDGFDAQEWAGTQSWSSGQVGTLGLSYKAWTQVYPAGLNNPHFAAIFALGTPPDPFRNYPVSHGVVNIDAVSWTVLVDGRTMQAFSQFDYSAILNSVPLSTMDQRFGRSLPVWHDWVSHSVLDDYWAAQSYQEQLLKSQVPALYVSGWYDDVLVGTLENFVNMTTRAVDPKTRTQQWMVIGPWVHGSMTGTPQRLGPIDFGTSAHLDLRELEKRWFDHWLNHVDNGLEREPHVRVFVMGANRWQSENEWPIARTQFVKYYLHSDGKANGLAGDGVLAPAKPSRSEPPDRFVYDPADPVPYLGVTRLAVGFPDDYREVEKRRDVLVYTTTPFTTATEICGPLRVTLVAASSARDTDWTAKIVDVHPDGYAQRLNDGIVRARMRHSDLHEEFLTPGKAETYNIDAWATCVELQPGHRLRLEISSSAVPKYSRNFNTGGRSADETHGIRANQTVFHDRARLSFLSVPIIPAAP